MQKNIKEAYSILGIERHNDYYYDSNWMEKDKKYEPNEIKTIICPEALCIYFDNYDIAKFESEDENKFEREWANRRELTLSENDKELCLALISSNNDELIGTLPVLIYAIPSKDKHGCIWYNKIEACDYFYKMPLFRLKKNRDSLQMLDLDNKLLKNLKIKLYELSNIELGQIEFGERYNQSVMSLSHKL